MRGGTAAGSRPNSALRKSQLAFAMDPVADEFIYEMIFTAPVRNVVETLQRYRTRSELWRGLPQSL